MAFLDVLVNSVLFECGQYSLRLSILLQPVAPPSSFPMAVPTLRSEASPSTSSMPVGFDGSPSDMGHGALYRGSDLQAVAKAPLGKATRRISGRVMRFLGETLDREVLQYRVSSGHFRIGDCSACDGFMFVSTAHDFVSHKDANASAAK